MTLGIRFAETMQGTLAPVTGAEPRTMTLRAHVHSPAVTGMWLSVPMTVNGTMDIAGLVDAAPTTGTIEVDLFTCQRIVYDLSWNDPEGRLSRFYGWKTLRLRHIVRSWTVLEGQVINGGELLGTARLRFDLKDLPAFLRSVRPQRH